MFFVVIYSFFFFGGGGGGGLFIGCPRNTVLQYDRLGDCGLYSVIVYSLSLYLYIYICVYIYMVTSLQYGPF